MQLTASPTTQGWQHTSQSKFLQALRRSASKFWCVACGCPTFSILQNNPYDLNSRPANSLDTPNFCLSKDNSRCKADSASFVAATIAIADLVFPPQGDRVDRPVRACFPEAASHLPQLQGQDQDHPTGQGRPKMVQGCWSGLPHAQDRH